MIGEAESIVREVMASETYRHAVAALAAEHDRTIGDIIALTEIAAPPFHEEARAQAFLALARQHGLEDLEIDAIGNVSGLFVADVGEEGEGDLRGVRYLFQSSRYKDRISAFITVDSPHMEYIATGGVGSKRYRVTFKGPGGHSYGAFGLVNPMFAMADAITRLSRIAVPANPRTTFSASVTGGGTSINSIPNSVWTEFDLRSESPAELGRLEASFLDLVGRAVAAENAARSTRNGPVITEIRKIGDRPAGRTDEGSALVSLARAAILAHGFQVSFESSSTDANIPMSLGIPAIKIGSGGTGGRAHSPEEWIDAEPQASVQGMAAGLTTLLAVAGLVR